MEGAYGNDMELWKAFDFAENTQDPGGGILYCLRYNKSILEGHRNHVISALKNYRLCMELLADKKIVIKPKAELTEDESNVIYLLLEELSVTNEALRYNDLGFDEFQTVDELRKGIIDRSYIDLLSNGPNIKLYAGLSINVPLIVDKLRKADEQNSIFSKKDRKALEDLRKFAKDMIDIMDTHRLMPMDDSMQYPI